MGFFYALGEEIMCTEQEENNRGQKPLELNSQKLKKKERKRNKHSAIIMSTKTYNSSCMFGFHTVGRLLPGLSEAILSHFETDKEKENKTSYKY